jgi:hydroxymethylglutaryl-CoA synthase
MRVGIDAISFAVPHRYIALEDLAVARGVDPAKYTQGLGGLEMAVAEPGEDTVALAARAASRVLAGVDRKQLGMLVVGTETGVDHSKPVASYVQGLLGLPHTMRVYDTQHACYGGTAALMAACDWIGSGAADGRSALVICSDIARYGLHSAGEPTQGAGAVAMIISRHPRVLAIDLGISGTASTHVHDFWRPLGQREAQVDGHYSVQCYLDALGVAYAGWHERAAMRGIEKLARVCYHVPFCKMAKKAHTHLFGSLSYDAQVAPSLTLNARVGNIYTGSLYLALAGLLSAQAQELAGSRVGMFSYGSGCTSEFFSGVVAPNADEQTANLVEILTQRERISVAEYERIMQLSEPLPRRGSEFQFTGVVEQRRQYTS